MPKTKLSFYCDDTNPYDAPAQAFKEFLDFASSEGIAGEASAILGYQWYEHGLLSRPRTGEQYAFIEQLPRAYTCGIDTHLELMTHEGLYDFEQDRILEGAIHEGVWMFEPAVTTAQYEAYLGHILADGEQLGVRFTGLTQPGCGCDQCTKRFHALRKADITEINSNLWQALANLAQQGKFRGRSVPAFIGDGGTECAARLMARQGDYGAFDLPPNLTDRFGLWMNDPAFVNPDYYIGSDGGSGRIVELVRAEVPYCIFFAHWQGLNPVNGVGWKAFTQVVQRVHRYLRDQVEWVRPSEYTDQLMLENHPL